MNMATGPSKTPAELLVFTNLRIKQATQCNALKVSKVFQILSYSLRRTTDSQIYSSQQLYHQIYGPVREDIDEFIKDSGSLNNVIPGYILSRKYKGVYSKRRHMMSHITKEHTSVQILRCVSKKCVQNHLIF
eukprot:3209_1